MIKFEFNNKQLSYNSTNPVAEGKTKKVFLVFNEDWSENDEFYVIEEKNIATAGDGARVEKIEWEDGKWKWDYSAMINANYFTYLNSLWIETWFIKKIDSNHTLVKRLKMIPVECVFRFVETGSYTKRQKHLLWEKANPDGTVLNNVIIELFYKDDVIDEKWEKVSDPLIAFDDNNIIKIDEDWFLVLLYPKTWETIDYKKDIETEKMKSQMSFIYKNYNILIKKTKEVWLWIKSFWEKVWLFTLDGKVEFWVDKDENIVLWDSIDADSNRIRKVFTVIWEDNKTYLTKEFTNEELETSWKSLSDFENLEPIPDNLKVKRLWIMIWLDKDWFRQWEASEDYLKKVKTLAEYSTKALSIWKI